MIKGTANENGNISTKKKVVKDKNGNEVTVVGDVDDETIEKIKNNTVMTESDGKTPLKRKEEKKTLKDFPFTEDGLNESLEWITQEFEDRKDYWMQMEKDKMKSILQGHED